MGLIPGGVPIIDDDAIHDNVAAEISALDAVTLADTDVFIVEDANAGTPYSKLKCLASAIWTYIEGKISSYLQNVSEDTTPTLGGTLDAADKQIDDAKTVTFNDEHANGNSGAAATINWNNGQKQTITLTGNCTFTFTAPTNGVGNFQLVLIQDSTGSRTAVWPGTVKWPAGTAPTLTTTLTTGTDVVSFTYNGTDYKGVASLDFQ